MTAALPDFEHPSWVTALSTLASYGLVLLVMTVLLFGVPYAAFTLL